MRAYVVILILLLAAFAPAKTTLDVDPGFGGRFRAGRWSPVFVTVQNDKPLTADIELHVANASGSVMSIRQTFGIGPDRQTYVLYAPLSMMDDPARVTLRDHDTGKTLASWPADGAEGNSRFGMGGEQIGFMAATSGRSPIMGGLTRSNVSGPTIVTHLRPSLLPMTPLGYDSLDLLVLNHPDLETMLPEQQQAILTWVRGGGTLVLWPGPDPLAPGPLVDALPAVAGDNGTIRLSPDQLQEAGLSDRFATIGTRTLAPRGDAVKIEMLGGVTNAIAGRLGLGRIEILPLDASTLQFNSADKSNAFWNALLDPFYTVVHENQNAYFNSPDMAAAQAALDRIGDIPGTGAFGFSYVLVMIAAMMVIVGPLDYLVLKKLGRQPWTWTTTAGWIGLFTAGALLAGRLFQNGDLHFRTLRLFEQAGDRMVGTDEVALVYAPRSATYHVTAPPGMWCQAVPSGVRYGSAGFTLPLDLDQDYRGCVPGGMWIDVWNFRFLQGRTYADGPGWIEAAVRLNNGKLTGTLRNLTSGTLRNVVVQYDGLSTEPIDIAPGQTATAAPMASSPPPPAAGGAIVSANSISTLFDIDPARSAAADRPTLAGAPKSAVVFAESNEASPDLGIAEPHAVQQHRSVYRATIDLLP